MRQTLKYKGAFIHLAYKKGIETATVQILDEKTFNYFTKEFKSFRSAQIFITKWMKAVEKKAQP